MRMMISLQIPTTFIIEEIFLSATECTVVSDVRQTKIHSAEPLVPEPIYSETEPVTAKLKGTKSR